MSKPKLKPATLEEMRAGEAALARKQASAPKPKKSKKTPKEVTPEVTEEPVEDGAPVEMETTIEDFDPSEEALQDDSLNDILGG